MFLLVFVDPVILFVCTSYIEELITGILNEQRAKASLKFVDYVLKKLTTDIQGKFLYIRLI